MFRIWGRRSAAWFACAVMALAVAAAGTRAQAGVYVDNALKDLTPAERITIASPAPVQLLFQFKTKGAANSRATKYLRDTVTEAVRGSGLFSEVSTEAVANAAILSVTIDNQVSPGAEGDAAKKGFVTGLTFGLKGSTVTDDYVCTVEYVGGPEAPKITKTLEHHLYTTIGATSPPENGVKAESMKEAPKIMARQVVSHGLNKLAADVAFNPAAPPVDATPVDAPPADAPAAVASAPAAPTTPVEAAASPPPAPEPAAPAAAQPL